jgi:hypothetical protein
LATKVKKVSWLWVVGTAVGLYNAFIVQQFWNWFAAAAFHVPTVSYWAMYGLLLLLGLVFEREEFADEWRWQSLAIWMDLCVPAEKQQALNEALEQQVDGMWVAIGFKVFGKLLGNTATLAVGWGVHVFLT